MTTYYFKDLQERAISTSIHFHSPERWRGLRAPQTADNWAADTVSAPFVLTSGDNAWGAEVQMLGPLDTPILAGSAKFDARPVLITDLSQAANPYKMRLVWGTGSYADAVTANQYSEFMFASTSTNAAQFGGFPYSMQMPNLASGTKVWAAVWCATNGATISMYLGVHEYPEITGDPHYTAGVDLPVNLDGIATGAEVAAVGATVTPKSTSVEVAAVGAAVAEVAADAAECVDNAGRRFNV
jgi:hypothetical protein